MQRILRHTLVAAGLAAAGSVFASVTFYEGENFAGRDITISDSVSNFDRTRFNDRASSVIVNQGQWEVCADADFSGGCQVFGPGRYPTIGGLSGRVSSVRPVTNMASPGRGQGAYRSGSGSGERGRPDDRGGARATLYEGGNLSGRSYSLEGRTMANLDGTGFNDRASSLRVDSGYWVFCSNANFDGECRTFGPGTYARLPAGLDNMITSGRRISNDFPYSQGPNWQR
jgi:hypothetical protein